MNLFIRTTTLFSICISLLFVSFSCDSTPKTTEDLPLISSQTEDEGTIEQPIIPISEPAQKDYTVYAGSIGDYGMHVVMKLKFTENKVTGNYFYSKHGKEISLSGQKEAASTLWKLEESINGATTGYLEFKIEGKEVIGSWSKSADMKAPQSIFIEELAAEYLPDFARTDAITGHYENKHEVMDAVAEKKVAVADQLQINRIDKNYFAFHYSTICTNYHLGQLSGIARFVTPDSAFFEIKEYEEEEACQLSFLFEKDNTVKIQQGGDCSGYKGARAWFGGSLTKVKK